MVARVESRPSGEHSAISCASFMAAARTLILRHAHVGEAHPGGLLAGHPAAGVENQFGHCLLPTSSGSVAVSPKPG